MPVIGCVSLGLFLGSLIWFDNLSVGFLPEPYCFEYHSFVGFFEIREHDASTVVFLSCDCFAYLGTIVVPYKFGDYSL